MEIILVVEDAPSEFVLRRIVSATLPKASIFEVLICDGFTQIKARMPRFINACKVYPHIVLADLDAHRCPMSLIKEWGIGRLPEELSFRIAIREVEAWLMADREGIARLLQVPVTRLPMRPEDEIDPKQCLVNIARRSRSSRFASEFCPGRGSKAKQGPLYNLHLSNFATELWDLGSAIKLAPSLARAHDRIAQLRDTV